MIKGHIKAAAVITSCLLTFSMSSGIVTAADDTTAAEETSFTEEASSETDIASADEEKIVPEEEINWVKADISDYDDSLSLISYELTTPDMYRLGDGLTDAQPAEISDDVDSLSEEQQAMILLMRKKLKNASPVLGRKTKSATPTAVEVYTSGGELKNIPEPQAGKVIESNPGEFAIQSFGWGHGVGMSQNGANFYAKYAGWTYQDILYHYYPGSYLMNTGTVDDEVLTIKHIPAGKTLDILAGIVYHEMGGCMAYEAMKAQAVAAYTFMKYNNDDSYDMRMKPNPPQRVIDACRDVLGQALYYNNDFCLTMFYASSGGTTSNSKEIFCQDLPYLRTVSGDYDAAYDPHYGSVTYINAATMRNKLETLYNIKLSDDPRNWLQLNYSPTSGYINSVRIDGQVTVQGYAFSVAMGLKSCKFNLTYTDYVGDGDETDEQSTPILSPDGTVAPPSELDDVPMDPNRKIKDKSDDTYDGEETTGEDGEEETEFPDGTEDGEDTTESETEPENPTENENETEEDESPETTEESDALNDTGSSEE